MSGEARATIQSTFYSIQYSSGISVSPAIPPNWNWEKDGDYTAHFFKEENRFFSEKLKDLQPELDKLFAHLIKKLHLPILQYDPKGKIQQSIDFHVNDLQSIEMKFTISEELSPENIVQIKNVIKILFENEREA